MNKQFLRLTLYVVTSLIILAISLEVIWEEFVPQETIISADDFYHSAIEENGQIFTIQPLNNISLPDELLAQLTSGEIIRLDDNEDHSYYYKLHQQQVLVLGPIIDIHEASNIDDIIAIVFYLGFAALLLLWFRPAFMDLRKLSVHVKNFSETAKWHTLDLRPTSIAFPAAHTINKMAERIEQLIDLQKNLSRMVGHEIRTPLARTGFSIASLKYDPTMEEILSIEEDLQEIEDLTEEFLQITKLEFDSKDIVLTKQNVYAPIEELVNKLQRASRINIKVDVDKNLLAPVENKTFKRLMQNLVTNALKHANDEVVIHLTENKGIYTLWVSDDGNGFSDSELIDKPYYQENSKTDGYGLGLSIVKLIASWYGGKISFESSNSLKGAKVIFTWPVDSDSP
ncbi:ATP-binding protein [Thalassotalea psychrophila]|uniref:histidine kinase n=1 Tax=Thalassotalea psychrophila TaxID=3065647 RepID=A0ABY9TYE1_9GAMM|nr:ATP-binding protein [Colwelliaceae bacterium SQ149]